MRSRRGPVRLVLVQSVVTESDQKALKTGPVRIFIFFKFKIGHNNGDFSIGSKHFHVPAKNLESIIRITDRTNLAVRVHHFIQDELLIFGSSVEKLADEFGTQTLRPNAGELASAMKNAAGKVGCVFVIAIVISEFGPIQFEICFLETFKKSAEYNCEWATSTTVPLLDQLWIYSGILSRVPQLVEVSEQSQQKIKNNANKVSMEPRTA